MIAFCLRNWNRKRSLGTERGISFWRRSGERNIAFFLTEDEIFAKKFLPFDISS
jgi:hypothetical protein